MAGVKGRSGRRVESKQLDARQRVIDKSWLLVEKILDDPKTPLQMKADIAKAIVTKNIPQEMQHSGDIKFEFAANGTLLSEAERSHVSRN